MTFDKELFDMDKLVCNGDMHAEDVLVLASSINKQLHRANEAIKVMEEALNKQIEMTTNEASDRYGKTPEQIEDWACIFNAKQALAKARELRGEG